MRINRVEKIEEYRAWQQAAKEHHLEAELATLKAHEVAGTWHGSRELVEEAIERVEDKLEKITKQKLLPQNSYARIYGTGASLKKHKDRPNCKLSVTLNLGGDPYPIYFLIKRKEVKVNLKPGDGIVYKGDKLIHWREKFKGSLCGQVFLHYNYSKEKIIYDGRRFIGMLKNKMIK